MLVAHYVGRHATDGLQSRLGWAIVRAVQRGDYRRTTHVEAVHEEHPDGTVTIASASLRDGGVRPKRARLTPGHWLIADVPQWSRQASVDLLAETQGLPYDWRGAAATVLPLRQRDGEFFCTEWVSHPFLESSHIFGPAQLAAITMSIGRDVTAEFFAQRTP